MRGGRRVPCRKRGGGRGNAERGHLVAEARDLGGVLVRDVGGRGRGSEGGDDQSVEADGSVRRPAPGEGGDGAAVG